MNAEQKYVLFICGGKWQLPWFQYLKEKGHLLALVDPYFTSPCVPLADVFIQCDARDVGLILQKVDELGIKILFVTSDQTDVATLPVAEISAAMGLMSNTPDVVELFSNKYQNRKFLRRLNLGHFPEFILISSLSELVSFQQQLGCRLIVKPVDAQSSRGIFTFEGTTDSAVQSKINEALDFSREPYLIAERFIEGFEITVEGFCNGGEHQVLAISDKNHFRTGIASELRYPARRIAKIESQLIDFHNFLIHKMGLQFGITHAEYMISPDATEFWLVEVACRGGGSLIPSHIVPWVSGFPVYDAFYECLTNGGKSSLAYSPIEKKSAILYFFEFPNGKVQKIEGAELIEKREDVFSFGLEFKVGDRILAANDDRSRQGYVIVKADNDTKLNASLEEIKNHLKVSLEMATP